jgi:ABC-type Fe3+-siderophore transport system permease subunit
MNGAFEELNFTLVLCCTIIGASGQFVRAVVGFWKLYNDPNKGTLRVEFDWVRFVLSLVVGAMIGAVFSAFYKLPLSNADVLGVLGASYAGTDTLEGALKGIQKK